jgi:RimJ/RimL family protein N-acetyltransferase
MTHTNLKYLLENQESERLFYRTVETSDFDTWLEFCNEEESLLYIFSPENMLLNPTEKCKLWFDRVNNRYTNGLGGMNALIEKSTSQFIGQCGLLIQTIDDTEELEIGYSLMPNMRGKGYASEAAKKCRNFAFENNYRESLISIIHPDNLASQKVALNNGMHLEKQAMHSDCLVNIYRITKDEWLKTNKK